VVQLSPPSGCRRSASPINARTGDEQYLPKAGEKLDLRPAPHVVAGGYGTVTNCVRVLVFVSVRTAPFR
jgi:hypothetical protein